MDQSRFYGGHFLLALPGMDDIRFDHSVIALCVHDEHGALGIAVGEEMEEVRLRDLLNAGSFEFSQLKGQNVPTTGPAMRVVTRNGRSLGATLVAEGLARPRFGPQQSWCP